MSVPIGAMYTPLKPLNNQPVNYEPVVCKQKDCGGILNPYCRVDFSNKLWLCPFCTNQNHFPPHYSGISSENRPAEIFPEFSTMEYIVGGGSALPPIFLFVIDTCMLDEELLELRTSVQQNLQLLPENALVGLITVNRNVHVHELGFEDCPKSFVIRGAKEGDEADKPMAAAKIAQLLGLGVAAPAASAAAPMAQPQAQSPNLNNRRNRFLMPISECEFTLNSTLEDLTKDQWPVKPGERSRRCLGTALNVAIGLLEAGYKGHSARILTFIGGPATIGPGMVVSPDLRESMRSHTDISKGNDPHYKKACAFYESIAMRAAKNGHVIDIFACALDQVGIAEMKVCVEKTGGLLVLDDSFSRNVFQGSFKHVFRREANNQDLAMTFSGELKVTTSREFKVTGAVGSATSLNVKGRSVSENETGIGNTCAWLLGGMDPNTTLAVFFEITNVQAPEASGEQRQAYLQFVTKYKHSTGRLHVRVTTVAKALADPKTPEGLSFVQRGFDQEAAAVLMARLAVFKTASEYSFDILRWLDRMLIRLMSKFASYVKDDPNTFKLPPEFAYYPQFMFHLRRSQFLQVFNSSPDETAFFRSIMIRENVTNSLIMIQPTLMAYSLDGPPMPVNLDVSSCSPQRILVLDTFFHVVIWYGDNIAKWREQKVHERPEYEYFAHLLAAPINDTKGVMESRFPYPRLIECVEKGSQSRFLMAKLNPSITQSTPAQQGDEPPVFTEDVSLKTFMQHLRKLAVQP